MTSKDKIFISAVVYVHNAGESVGVFLETIAKIMDENTENFEIICVNDYSTDDSVSIIRNVSKKISNTNITILNLSYYHGIELAMCAGMDLAIGDFVFEFDNTKLDYDNEVIKRVYKHSIEGYDIVSASSDRGDRFTSRLFYKTFDKFADRSYKMTTESFRILSRRVINRVNSINNHILYRKAVYASSGFKTDTIPYTATGKEKIKEDRRDRGYRANLAIDSLLLFTEFGYKVSMIMTIAMMLISVFMVIYSVITYIVYHPVEGWTTTILFLSFAFFGLFAILTIIIKYLQLIINMIYKRKHYSYESIEKLTES